MAQWPARTMGTGVSPGNPEDGTWLPMPGSGAVHLQAPTLHREGSVPSVPSHTGKGSQTSLHGIKAPFLFGSEYPRSGAGWPREAAAVVGVIPKATRCGRGSHPEGAGGGGEGTGMGRSGLGHCVLIEVRRYESIKNHFLPNSCQERRAMVRAAFPHPSPFPGHSRTSHLSQWCRSLSLSLSRCRSCSRLRSGK